MPKTKPSSRKNIRGKYAEWFLAPVAGPVPVALAELYPGGQTLGLRVKDSHGRVAERQVWPCAGMSEARSLAERVRSAHPDLGFDVIARNPDRSPFGRVIARVNAI